MFSKVKARLNEVDISRDKDGSCGKVDTFIATMRESIAYEDAFVRAKVQFGLVVRPKVELASTSKNSLEVIIESEVKKFLKRENNV